MSNVLEIHNLETSFFTKAGEVQAVRNISFSVEEGEITAIIGESGCGKSVTALSILNMLSGKGKVKSGEVIFKEKDILKYSEKQMLKIRGEKISMVFQNSMTALNPLFTIGNQMSEMLQYHKKLSKKEALKEAEAMLKNVGIPYPEERLKSYPHELSGGMRQRVAIAMALSCNPELLIADEPTTALDVTLQIQILDLIKEMASKMNTAVLLITHDLGVVANICSKVIVMYAGKIMEEGTVQDIFLNPLHPYAQGLLKTVQDLNLNTESELYSIEGMPPQLLNPPKGCPFAERCSLAKEKCFNEMPESFEENGHKAYCWLLK